jgi:hypothetical protein
LIPVPKSSELIDQLRPLLTQRRPSELAVRKIRVEAEKLIKQGKSPADGHMLLGSIDALEFDVGGFVSHFRIAQQLSSSRNIPFNLCVMARRIGCFNEARRVADSLLSHYPDDVAILNLVNEVGGLCCDFEMLFEARERLERLGKPAEGIDRRKFLPVCALRNSLGVTTDQIVERLEAAVSVLVDAREPNFGAVFDVSPEGTLAYGFGVDASATELAEYSLTIADVLLDRFEDPLSHLITISCLKKRELRTRELSNAGAEASS